MQWLMITVKVILALCTFILALLALFNDYIPKPWKYSIFGLLVSQFAFSIIEIYLNYEEDRKATTTGILSPIKSYEKFPEFITDFSGEEGATIRMGESQTYFTLAFKDWKGAEGKGNPETPRAIFSTVNGGEDTHVFLWLENGRPRIGLKLFNRRNQMVAHIDGNRWFVKREFLYDINYDNRSVEIRNDEGKIQLQLVFYENIIQLSMINYFQDDAVALYGDMTGGRTTSFDKREADPIKLKPIFKYPSVEYLGVRLNY